MTLLDELYRLAEVGGFLITLLTVIIGGGKIFYRMGKMAERFEFIGARQAEEITELKDNVKELIKRDKRLDLVEQRQLLEGKRMDEFIARFNRAINGMHS